MAKTIGTERLQTIVVEADLGIPARGYTPAERAFRAKIDEQVREIKARGGEVVFGGWDWEADGYDIDFPEAAGRKGST